MNELARNLLFWTVRVGDSISYAFTRSEPTTMTCQVSMSSARRGRRVADAVYIGETHSLKDLLTENLYNHHTWQSICTMQVTGVAASRVMMETDLRNSRNPFCHRQ
jgi:hypothetical protein